MTLPRTDLKNRLRYRPVINNGRQPIQTYSNLTEGKDLLNQMPNYYKAILLINSTDHAHDHF